MNDRAKERLAELCRATTWVLMAGSVVSLFAAIRFDHETAKLRQDIESMRERLASNIQSEATYSRVVEDMARVGAHSPSVRAFMERTGLKGVVQGSVIFDDPPAGARTHE